MSQWQAKPRGGYIDWDSSATVTPDTEAFDNAEMIWGTLGSLAWNLPAVSAFIGVCCYESGLNPWRWQSDVLIAHDDNYNIYQSTAHGYGLNQFTPMGTYINGAAYSFGTFAPNYSDVSGMPHDGDSQCRFVNKACVELGYYFKRPNLNYQYPYMNFQTFISVTDAEVLNGQITFENLVYQWLNNYSRGAQESNTSWKVRVNSAKLFYIYLYGGEPPIPPTPPGPTPIPTYDSGKWWKYLPRLYRPF